MKGSKAPIRNTGKGKKPWLLDLRYLGGKREFFETEEDAKTKRQSSLRKFQKLGSFALSITDAETIDFVRARDRLREYGSTINDAVEFFAKHHTVSKKVALSDAIQEFIEAKLASKKNSRYVKQLGYNLNLLKDKVGDLPLNEISNEELESWLYSDKKWSSSTIRAKQIDVGTFFRFSKSRNWIVYDPATALERVALPDTPPGILTPDECAAVLSTALNKQPQFLRYLVLCLFCGIRREEVSKLEQVNVQAERGFVEIAAKVAKTRKRRLVDISENAKAWLAYGKEVSPKGENWFQHQLVDLRPRVAKALERESFNWPKNCLRHSFASYHLAMHGSADRTALQMGHRSTEMLFRHYRELVTRQDAEKFWSIIPTQ